MSIYIFYHVFYLVLYPLLIYVHANSVKFFNLHMKTNNSKIISKSFNRVGGWGRGGNFTPLVFP